MRGARIMLSWGTHCRHMSLRWNWDVMWSRWSGRVWYSIQQEYLYMLDGESSCRLNHGLLDGSGHTWLWLSCMYGWQGPKWCWDDECTTISCRFVPTGMWNCSGGCVPWKPTSQVHWITINILKFSWRNWLLCQDTRRRRRMMVVIWLTVYKRNTISENGMWGVALDLVCVY